MNNMPCEVIKDLLPSYIDELTSEASNRLIEEHLSGCAACRETLNSMKEKTPADTIEEKTEIDFLKKNRRKNKWIIFSCIWAILIILAMVFITRYVIGEHKSDLDGNYFNWAINVDGNHMELDAWVTDDIYKITGFKHAVTDGVLYVEADVVPSGRIASLIYGKEFHTEYTSKEPFHQVQVNGRILWNDGDEISVIASRLYIFRHEYIGNASSNAQTARALNIYNYLGPYTSELETAEPPYDWKIILSNGIPESQLEIKENVMVAFSYFMIATIGNLDSVTWQYIADGQTITKTITKEDASAFFGQDIKDCYDDVSLLDMLMQKTGLNRWVFGSVYSDSSYIPDEPLYEVTFPVSVVSNADEVIAGITVTLYINGEPVESLEAENLETSHAMIEKGDLTHIWIGAELFEDAIDSNLELYFTVLTSDGRSMDIPDGLQIPANSNTHLHDIHLYGNQTDGFYVSQ